MTIGIYEILNKSDNKRYVGSSTSIENRRAQHFAYLRGNYHPNRHLQSAFNKYGEENFKFTILEQCDETTILDREKYYISIFSVLDDKFGYNLAPEPGCGSRGFKWSDKSKFKLSNSLKQLYATGKRQPRKTRLSVEAKLKISKSLKEQHNSGSREHCKQLIGKKNSCPIYCHQTSKIYDSCTLAAKELGLSNGNISSVLTGRRRHTKGYTFVFVKEKKGE